MITNTTQLPNDNNQVFKSEIIKKYIHKSECMKILLQQSSNLVRQYYIKNCDFLKKYFVC
jgi:hypothetical protein